MKLLSVVRISLAIAFALFNSGALQAANAGEGAPLEQLFEVNEGNWAYVRLTDAGVKKVLELRKALMARNQLFEEEYKGLTTTHHCLTVARCVGGGNALIYGPGGGAKSAILSWMDKGENAEDVYSIVFNPTTPESAVSGGQDFEKAKQGKHEINIETSVANYKVAHLDEFNQASPPTMTALQSILNEREIRAGGKLYPAKTEFITATMNSNMLEFLEKFSRTLGDMAPALANRFQYKIFTYNWLKTDYQTQLNDRAEDKRYKKAIAKYYPNVKKDVVFTNPPQVDWDALNVLANVLMKPNDDFYPAFTSFTNEVRSAINKEARDSELRHIKNRYEEPYIFTPSCDFTERLRQQMPKTVVLSAFLDYLLSDLAKDERSVRQSTAKQIPLGPLSLWRTYLIMTTVGPGETQLARTLEGELDLLFQFDIDEKNVRTSRETRLVAHLKKEQQLFKDVFLGQMKQYNEAIQDASKALADMGLLEGLNSGVDFENVIRRRK